MEGIILNTVIFTRKVYIDLHRGTIAFMDMLMYEYINN